MSQERPGARTSSSDTKRFYLNDDGTMDTVVTCSRCSEDMRYTYDGCEHEQCDEGDCYDAFVEWAIEDAEAEHECITELAREEGR